MPSPVSERPRLRARRIDAHSPALATPQGRQKAWVAFQRWLEPQLQDPNGPRWQDVEALVSQVLPAVQQALDTQQCLQWRLQVGLRDNDPLALHGWLLDHPIPLVDSPVLRDLVRRCQQAPVDQPAWQLLSKTLHRRCPWLSAPASPRSEPGQDPRPEPALTHPTPIEPIDPLARWFKVAQGASPRSQQAGPLRYWVARGPQAPQTEDDQLQAQAAVLGWMLRELENPNGLRWSALMDVVCEIETAWRYRLDRDSLLSLCVWTAQQHNHPGLLLQFLNLLTDGEPAECPLDGLIEQAMNEAWAPDIRTALLQAIATRLSTLDEATGPLHAHFLKALFALPEPQHRATLLQHYRAQGPFHSYSETARLLDTVSQLDAASPAPPDNGLDRLDSLKRRETRASRTVWLVLSRALLERVALPLAERQRSADATQATAANALIRQLLFRLAHPEAGDKAQAIEDQFGLLDALVHALPSGHREAFLQRLDAAYASQVDKGLQALLTHSTRPAPITALAMRGAIQALLQALPRQEPPSRPARTAPSTTGKAMRFFADWFAALRPPGTGDLAGIQRLYRIELFQVLMDPLTRDLTALMDALFTLHGLPS